MEIAVLLIATLLTSTCMGLVYGQTLVTFGDSLTDNGYGSKYVQRLLNTTDVYPAPPYYKGRFSNGPAWVENAAASLGIELEGYAMGGACAGAAPSDTPPFVPPFAGLTEITPYNVPDLGGQVDLFLADNNNVASPDRVYLIAAGGNDIFQAVGLNLTAAIIADFVEEAVQTLYGAGARKFIIVAPPDAAVAIGLAGTPIAPAISEITTDYLVSLAAVVAEAGSLPGATAMLFDFGQADLQGLTATNIGFSNTSACHDPVIVQYMGQPIRDYSNGGGYTCTDPSAHVSWDGIHPTEPLHKALGSVFVADFGPVFWSSPQPRAPAPSVAATAPVTVGNALPVTGR